MKFLAAAALLFCVTANAYLVSKEDLLSPLFIEGQTHVYNVEIDLVSSISGLSAQHARFTLKAAASIYAKSKKEHVLKLTNVRISGPLTSVSDYDSPLTLHSSKDLEDQLSIPIQFMLEKKQVTSYTLDDRETLESKKIKKSILRALELYVDEEKIHSHSLSDDYSRLPITYNLTRKSPVGDYQSHYAVTSSPYEEFPLEKNVLNVSRSDNYENIRYPSHVFQHNFKLQGCPDVCKNSWTDNKYGAGCPSGFEPHQSHVKIYYNHHHRLVKYQNVMVPEDIDVDEYHIAKSYDQKMEIFIRIHMRRNSFTRGTISAPAGQPSYTDLHDYEAEINEQEINDLCKYQNPQKAIEASKTLLNELADIVVSGDLEDKASTLVGEKLVLLQKSLAMLKKNELEIVEREISKLGTLSQSSDKDKVKRQIWIDLLGLIGTSSSVSYISSYIQRSVKRDLTVWEATEILEALPENIHKPNEAIVKELMKLWELKLVSEYHLLHSAAYITVGKVINKLCGQHPISSESSPASSSWMGDYKRVFSTLSSSTSSESSEPSTCPMSLVNSIVEKLVQKLEQSQSKQKKAIYIQALAQMNTLEAVKHLAEYSFGIAEGMQEYTPSQVNFFKVLTLFALHNNIRKYPQQVLQIATPIFFNRSEEAKVRNAAFSAIMRCQPSRELLEHIVHDTWYETSLDVGSFVTSSLETFGNSSMPCEQLTAERIKMVISQAKRFVVGYQHSKNLYYSFNDDLRSYGHEGRLQYSSNGESIVPSTLYHACKFITRNMHEVASQTAINIEGVTSKMILDKINEYIGLKIGKPLTSSQESEIFGQMKHEEKIPEEFKMTFYNRFFYASSYYYIEDPSRDFAPIMEHFEKYFKAPGRNYQGTYVKAMLPSTLHAVTAAKAVPFPVELEFKYPYLLAIQLKNNDRGRIDPRNMHLSMKFSMYLSRLLTQHIKNLRDCKEIGVYYEHKINMNVPYEISIDLMNWNKVKVEYGFKNLPRMILSTKTEAGTFIGKKELDRLPQMSGRSPIKRVPEQFKREQKLDIIGLPPMHISTHTENMAEGYESIPRNIPEALEWITTKTLNAGWRSRSVNVTMDTNSIYWPSNTKISFEINYSRQHHNPEAINMMQSRQKSSETDDSEDDIVKDLDVDEDMHSKKATDWMSRGRRVYQKLVSSYPHMQHVFDIQVKTTPVSNKAYFRAEYNHTLGRHVHVFHMDAAVNLKRFPIPIAVSADHIIGFLGRPSEFKFDKSSFSHQRGRFLSSISLHHAKPFENVDLLIGGSMRRVPLSKLLNDMLVSGLDSKHFLPQDYEQCERDTEVGKALSKECVKSISEMSNFNKYKVFALWSEGKLPGIYRRLAQRIESLARTFAMGHVNVSEKEHHQNMLGLDITYIDKLSDNPLIDITLEKPSESVSYQKLPAGIMQPLSSLQTIFDTYMRATTNNTYPATCIMMEKYLTTYDQKTYPLPSENCQYLISAPCTQYKRFAVLGRNLSNRDGTKEITLYVGDHKIILSPKEARGYRVNVDGQVKSIHVSSPVILEDEHTDLSVSLNIDVDGSFLEVYDNTLGLKLTYNGKNIKIQVNPIFKGELCGLCSTFDGETVKEYLAPDGCLYANDQDFIKRSIVNPDECHATVDPSVPKICYSNRGHYMQPQSTSNTVRRNVVKHQEDRICFSVEPVFMCDEGHSPAESEEESVGFHCLPKNDITTQKLVSEASVKELEVMRNKKTDYFERVTVAKQC